MEDFTYHFVALVVLAAGLAAVAISGPRPLWVRASSLGLGALLMLVAYASLANLLGQPKPLTLEWRPGAIAEAEVLGASIREGEAIYVWLATADREEPQSYRLPWNRDHALSLQAAQREAGEQGQGVRVRLPREGADDDDELVFYAPPQPPRPAKVASAGD